MQAPRTRHGLYGTAYGSLSDIRLKGDIRDAEVQDATKVIEAMQIHSFERKDSHKKYKIGFIADASNCKLLTDL